ncbi:hypothetical protein RUM43_001771 [Polyplax serrata]|uniref:Uncharacterized protein n=1 Tax=Polyplax serrata TaxID=468196 RepID=A0AAN8SFB6_POLSC
MFQLCIFKIRRHFFEGIKKSVGREEEEEVAARAAIAAAAAAAASKDARAKKGKKKEESNGLESAKGEKSPGVCPPRFRGSSGPFVTRRMKRLPSSSSTTDADEHFVHFL